jgi:hypothetical protein
VSPACLRPAPLKPAPAPAGRYGEQLDRSPRSTSRPRLVRSERQRRAGDYHDVRFRRARRNRHRDASYSRPGRARRAFEHDRRDDRRPPEDIGRPVGIARQTSRSSIRLVSTGADETLSVSIGRDGRTRPSPPVPDSMAAADLVPDHPCADVDPASGPAATEARCPRASTRAVYGQPSSAAAARSAGSEVASRWPSDIAVARAMQSASESGRRARW